MGKYPFIKFTDDFVNTEKMILRDHLAMERTKLANERTLFSYIRTSLYLLVGGIGLIELKTFEHLKFIGYISFGFSGILLFIGFYRFLQMKRHLKKFIEMDKNLDKEENINDSAVD